MERQIGPRRLDLVSSNQSSSYRPKTYTFVPIGILCLYWAKRRVCKLKEDLTWGPQLVIEGWPVEGFWQGGPCTHKSYLRGYTKNSGKLRLSSRQSLQKWKNLRANRNLSHNVICSNIWGCKPNKLSFGAVIFSLRTGLLRVSGGGCCAPSCSSDGTRF